MSLCPLPQIKLLADLLGISYHPRKEIRKIEQKRTKPNQKEKGAGACCMLSGKDDQHMHL
jgi:hypothetical protein